MSPEPSQAHRPLARRAAACLLLFSLGFTALTAAAMASYPGGSWIDRSDIGHHFFRNFFCDLTQPVALNGAPNPVGSALAQAGMLALVGAFVPFWILTPTLFPEEERHLGSTVRALGIASIIGLIAVPLTPSGRYGVIHAFAIFAAGIPGVLAAILAAFGLRRVPRLRAIAAGTLLASCVNAAFYVHNVITDGPVGLALPAIQKLAALGLLLWMVVVGVTVLRGPRGLA